MTELYRYTNGNAEIVLFTDGTRTLSYDDDLHLDYPLNIDIRVQTRCQFGLNPTTGKAICSFCHESATTDGKECDYSKLLSKLVDLPKGVELAVGCNELTAGLAQFCQAATTLGFVVNLTVNQGNKSDFAQLHSLMVEGFVRGLGVSYRRGFAPIPSFLLNHPNAVVHMIVGIDTLEDVEAVRSMGAKKLLVLGEKDFGFNHGKVDRSRHLPWYRRVHELFDKFDVVSFDNLALEQLAIQRFFSRDKFNTFNQGEHSMYINAVAEYYAPSSRSSDIVEWSMPIPMYFKERELECLMD